MISLTAIVIALASSGAMFAVGIAAGFGSGMGAGIGSGISSGRKQLEEQIRNTITRRGLQVQDMSGHTLPADVLFEEAAGSGPNAQKKKVLAGVAVGVGLVLLGLLLAFLVGR